MTVKKEGALPPQRRRWLKAAAGAAVLVSAAGHWPLAQAKAPVRFLVGFPAGGGTDAAARLLAARLQEAMGETIVVENKPGAGGQLAAQTLKLAEPDGRTFFVTHDHTISILPKVFKVPGFDPDQDFEPVAGFATFVNAFAVNAEHPAQDFKQYLQWVKSQKSAEAGSVGIPAPASTPEFLVDVLAREYEIDLTAIPYRGSAPMLSDLLGAQIDAGIASVQELMAYHHAGKLRVLAVLGSERQSVMPEVPTLHELGIAGFELTPYYGIYAPKGLPAAERARWEAAIQSVIAQPDLRQQFHDWGMNLEFMDHDQLHSVESRYSKAWAEIIDSSGFTPK